jgi:hypothetical protein
MKAQLAYVFELTKKVSFLTAIASKGGEADPVLCDVPHALNGCSTSRLRLGAEERLIKLVPKSYLVTVRRVDDERACVTNCTVNTEA